jgi:hypothetical protein
MRGQEFFRLVLHVGYWQGMLLWMYFPVEVRLAVVFQVFSCTEILVLWSKTFCMAKYQQNNNIQLPCENFLSMKNVHLPWPPRRSIYSLKISRPPQLGPQYILTWQMTTATVEQACERESLQGLFGGDLDTFCTSTSLAPAPLSSRPSQANPYVGT